jgi:hypothetical protein
MFTVVSSVFDDDNRWIYCQNFKFLVVRRATKAKTPSIERYIPSEDCSGNVSFVLGWIFTFFPHTVIIFLIIILCIWLLLKCYMANVLIHGSWVYNYICNQYLSPLKLWIWIPFMARCTRYNIMWYSLSVTYER